MSIVYYKLCKTDSSLIIGGGGKIRLLLKLTVEHVK